MQTTRDAISDKCIWGNGGDGYNMYVRMEFLRLAVRRWQGVDVSRMSESEKREWESEWASHGKSIYKFLGMRRGDISSEFRSQILEHLTSGRVTVARQLINNPALVDEVKAHDTQCK